MKQLLTVLILTVFTLSGCAKPGIGVKNDVCEETETANNVIVCFSDDFKETAEDNGFTWSFEIPEEDIKAVTFTKLTDTGTETLLAFRKRLDLDAIHHELAHVQDHYGAQGERGAQLIQVIGNFVLQTAHKHEIPLYYRTADGKVALGRGYEL